MKKYIISTVLLLLLFVQPVSAKVVTTQKTQGYADFVYVAGSPDNYPVEYYDEDSEEYKGVIPDFLGEISLRTGIDFVYINGDKKDKNQLAKNLQVEIVSCIDEQEETSYSNGYLELFTYEYEDKSIKCGLLFTTHMDAETASLIERAVNEITVGEKNGIYLSYAERDTKIDYGLLVIAAIVVVLLCCVVVYLIRRIKKLKKENELDKFTDAETGMGNLQFFKHHFRYTLGDVSRSLYHLAYIVLDSSYLRSYHGDNSFEDVLKYTAVVLNENTGDREVSARITENGFAFAFQSSNDEDAEKRLEETIKRLNEFETAKENDKLVFHCAVYKLRPSDKNCELLLFNLRKNCNKIFGTETQIVFCDIHSMNAVQEEKKITESILEGFDNNEFKMYLQFIVDNKTKKITSAEALSRWESREKGLLGPNRYIENMEYCGVISKHDFYMFDLACKQLERWKNTEYGDISISCNFTRITLSEEAFIEKISMISNSYDFDKSKLCIEITEDAIEKDREMATQNVKRCKELGFKVYLDDLGSGYTSLSNLCDYPIDVVKIDRDILLKAQTPKGRELFDGIIALAHSLNIKVICEGVETTEQNGLVSSSDCDYIQGWFYSKAFPAEESEAFMEKYKREHKAV